MHGARERRDGSGDSWGGGHHILHDSEQSGRITTTEDGKRIQAVGQPAASTLALNASQWSVILVWDVRQLSKVAIKEALPHPRPS